MSDTAPGAHQALPAPLRVLLLDDDSFMLELLHEMLKEIGTFDIVLETAARRALATLASTPPALPSCLAGKRISLDRILPDLINPRSSLPYLYFPVTGLKHALI